tara:strand:- start:7072 stop:7188 length:117 start_codon:yes stop_codon:yes gene_type:complete
MLLPTGSAKVFGQAQVKGKSKVHMKMNVSGEEIVDKSR